MRAVFLVPWPSQAASTRLRAEQYFPYLRAQGVEPVLRPFMSLSLYGRVYERGHLALKTLGVLAGSIRRLVDVLSASRSDVVFIHREAFPFGTTLIERAISHAGVPIVLDFDDAIYLPATSAPNGFVRYFKRPRKVDRLIRLSQTVVTGNGHLQRYAARINPNTVVVPTPVDARLYRPRTTPHASQELVIGWIGSGTTARYVNQLTRPIGRILEKYPHVRVVLTGGRVQDLEHLPRVTYRPWSLHSELGTLQEFDLGLMPYPDSEWARGKCAFKALLYMSVGIPAVCSDVGMASEMIDSGANGFLARSEDDWYDILDLLANDRQARERVGRAGRELVSSQYSLERHAPRLLDVLLCAAAGKSTPGIATEVRARAGNAAHPDASCS